MPSVGELIHAGSLPHGLAPSNSVSVTMRLGPMPAPSAEQPAGTLRFAGAPRPGLLPPMKQKAQINPGLSLSLDEKRGSRHHQITVAARMAVARMLRASLSACRDAPEVLEAADHALNQVSPAVMGR